MKRTWLVLWCFASSFIYAQEQYDTVRIAEELKRNAHSVIRYEKVSIDVPRQNKIITTIHRAVTVLDKTGDSHLESFVSYDNDRRIRKLQAKVYDAKGELIEKYNRSDFLDVNQVEGGTLYSDNRLKIVPFTPDKYPYTMVMDYAIESNNTIYFPNWFLYTTFHRSIESRELQISYDPSIELRHKLFDPEGILEIKQEPGFYSVKSSNCMPLIAEPYGPEWSQMVPNILFATDKFHLEGIDGVAKSWEEFGKWEYDNLIHGLDELPDKTIEKISAYISHAKTEKEKVKLIYDYVQKNTRYISVQLGIGGLRPYSAKEVDKLGYGDCKGLSNYTKALLKSQGIESYYAEVWAGNSRRDIDTDFVSIQGNHVILNVPLENEDIWLECTSQTAPFNFLGDFTDDRNVLLLTKDGGKIKRTPKYPGDQNKITTNANYSIDENGKLIAEIEMTSTGLLYDKRYAIETLDKKDRELYYKNYWDYIDNISIDFIELNNNKDDIIFTEKLKLQARSYASKAGNKLFVPLNAFDRITSKPAINKNRKRPIVLEREYVYDNVYTIHVPEGYAIQSLPKPVEISETYGVYSAKVELISEREIRYQRTFQRLEGTYEPDNYEAFRQFWRRVNKGDNQKLVLTKSTN